MSDLKGKLAVHVARAFLQGKKAAQTLRSIHRAWVKGERVKAFLKPLPVEASGHRTRVDGHVLVPVPELMKIREFKRPVNPDLRDAVEARGWTTPVHVILGKDGSAMVAEGNHRVALADSMGIESLPVVIHLREKTRGERLNNADLDYDGVLEFEERWGDPEWEQL